MKNFGLWGCFIILGIFLPGIGFAQTTGIMYPGGSLTINVGGQEVLRATNAKRVGIGTTNPATELEVSGTISATHLVGDGSGLTNLSVQGDRITSGTTNVTVNSATSTISFTTNGSVANYLDSSGRLVTTGISVTTNQLSATTGYFSKSVGVGTSSPNASALLDMESTTKGFLPPQMTTAQRDAISSPATGLVVYNTTTSEIETYNGSAWVAGWGIYDIAVFMPSTPNGNARIRVILPRIVSLPQNLTSSQCKARAAATAQTTVTLNKISGGSTTAIGTAVWAAAGTTCTFTFASSVSFAAGDLLEIIFPSSADTTLADIAITFVGTKS